MSISPFLGAEDAALLLARGEIRSVELVEAAIDRILRLNQRVNALVVNDFDAALVAAAVADRRLRSGEKQPLLGVPITVKESLSVSGMPTTFGIPQFREWRPKVESLAVKRLRAAGAIILGKTNVCAGLADWQCVNPVYGRTNNPRDPNRTAGGSSGGSAAAIACGLSFLELGSDVAGSIRIPAHFCGVFGHRPTQNLVSTQGSELPGRRLSSALAALGPIARTANDLAVALRIIAGPDSVDALAWKVALPPSRFARLRDARVLVLIDHPLVPLANSIRRCIEGFVEMMRNEGVTVDTDTTAVPDLAEGVRIFMRLLTPSALGNLSADHYEAVMERARELSPTDTSLAAEGLRACLGSQREWLLACEAQARQKAAWRSLFQACDIVICPVSPTPAFLHDERPMESRMLDVDGWPMPYLDQLAWVSIATLCGFPATTIPFGETEDGLPTGLQVMGPDYADVATITFAGLLEQRFGGFVPPPLFNEEYRGIDQGGRHDPTTSH